MVKTEEDKRKKKQEEEEDDDSSSSSSSSEDEDDEEEEVKKPVAAVQQKKKPTVTAGKRKREESDNKKEKKAPAKKKKKKDPNEPKRPKTGYLRFCDDHRKQVQEELKSNNVTLVSKELGRMWKELDPKTKSEYNGAFAKDNEVYKVNIQEYKANKPSSEDEPEEEVKKIIKKKKKKDPNAPKRPLTGYMLYAKEVRGGVVAENQNMKTTDIAKIIGKMWKGMTDEERQRYNTMYKEQKKVYDVDFKQYKQDHPSDSSSEEEEEKAATPAKKKKAKRPADAPKGPPNSYNLFSSEIRQKVKDENPTLEHLQITKIIAAKWKEMSKDQKEKYATEASKKKAEHEKIVKNYEANQKKKEKIDKSTAKPQQPKRKKNNVIDDEDEEEESDEESGDEGSGAESGDSSGESSGSDSDE